MKTKRKRSALTALKLMLFGSVLVLLMAQARPAAADGLLLHVSHVTYYDVSTSANVSASGYGGPGSSGGAGDNTVRLLNPTAALGSLCAMIYVFDDHEQMQTCCGCPVSPDGLRTLSTLNDLTQRFGVNKGDLASGVIKIMSSARNFDPGNPPPAPLPPGTNGATNGACAPTGSFGDTTFHRGVNVELTRGIRAYITHDEKEQPGNIAGGKAAPGVSVDEFQDSRLDETEFFNLEQTCENLISNGSGVGVCTCGVGDDQVVGRPKCTVSSSESKC